MLAITHTVVGSSFAFISNKPEIAIPLAFISHFALDVIPHWHLKDKSKNLYYQVGIDVTLSVIFLIFLYNFTNSLLPIYAGIAGALMDLDAFFYYPKLGKYRKYTTKVFPDFISQIHSKVQNETKSYWGIVTQVVITFAALVFIFAT